MHMQTIRHEKKPVFRVRVVSHRHEHEHEHEKHEIFVFKKLKKLVFTRFL
jgi:hypothetical protein